MKKLLMLALCAGAVGCVGTQKRRECGPFPNLLVQVGGVYKAVDICVDELDEITWRISDRPLPRPPRLRPAKPAAPPAAPSAKPDEIGGTEK